MAVWQFKITLVPKRWLADGGSIAALVSDDGWETAAAWAGFDGAALELRIDGILPKGKSWYPSIALWGSEERSDIQLSRDKSEVESLGVRFDLRNPDMALFRAVVGLAQDLDLAILDMLRKREIANLNELLRAAAESEAAHFVLDPASFLSQLGTNARAT